MDIGFATAEEIATELGRRLKGARLAQALQQADLAQRAGVSVGTVKTLEKTGQSTLVSLIRVAQALGLVDDLQPVFALKIHSIAEMEQAERSRRQRAPRGPRAQG